LAANTTTDSLVQPALYGGLVVGVLSALPIVSAGNLCCCLWVLCGGLVAAFVLQQRRATPITQGDGALVGLLAGVVGAFVFVVVKIPIDLVAAPVERELMQRLLDNNAANLPPELRQLMTSHAAFGAGMAISFVLMLIVGAIFSTLGGLLGAIFFRKSAPPSATAPPTETAPPAATDTLPPA
jgi:hypothetical protein